MRYIINDLERKNQSILSHFQDKSEDNLNKSQNLEFSGILAENRTLKHQNKSFNASNEKFSFENKRLIYEFQQKEKKIRFLENENIQMKKKSKHYQKKSQERKNTIKKMYEIMDEKEKGGDFEVEIKKVEEQLEIKYNYLMSQVFYKEKKIEKIDNFLRIFKKSQFENANAKMSKFFFKKITKKLKKKR